MLTKIDSDTKWLIAYGAVLAGVAGYLWCKRNNRHTNSELEAEKRRARRLKSGYQAMPIYRICITGGPCGGKTTCMKDLKEYFTQKGYRVFCVPELATLTVHGGGVIVFDKDNVGLKLETERLMMKIQLVMEQYFLNLAALSDLPTLILYDRGVMDMCAYVTIQERDAIFDQEQWKVVQLRDERYDLVMHLVTAADGAEKFYTKSNNDARTESIELAKQLDLKTMAAYSAHPHFHAIPNIQGQNFQKKVQRCIHAIEDYIKPCSSSLKTKRFLVSQVRFPADLTKERLEMRVTFLRKTAANVEEDKLVRRGNDDSNIYIRWRKIVEDGVEYYTERRLIGQQYIKTLSEEADPNYIPLKYFRTVFVYQKQQFNFDEIKIGKHDLLMLSYFCRQENLTLVKLPQFIQIDRDISQEIDVTLQALSRRETHDQVVHQFQQEDEEI